MRVLKWIRMTHASCHIYIDGLDFVTVMAWILRILPVDLTHHNRVDALAEIGVKMHQFICDGDVLWLEQKNNDTWLELTVIKSETGSRFAHWSSMTLGELVVDQLGGIALADCEGVYASPYSDKVVRISVDKLELIRLPSDIGQEIDEQWTKLIEKRL